MTLDVTLGEFLRSRRKASDPGSAPLPSSGLRRVRGLRREEIAQLAGVSVDYYARLEQGRQAAPSESVLTSIAAALDLDETERLHLFDLAHSPAPVRDGGGSAQSARPGLIRLMETLGTTPAVLHGRGTDVLAVNEAARAVITDFYAKPARDRNVARWFFLDEDSRRFDDWDNVAGDIIGVLRLDIGRYPSDSRLQSLVEDMKAKSPLFCEFWEKNRVAIDVPAHKVVRHPTAGTLEFEVEGVSPPSDRDQTLYIFMMKPGSPTEEAVERLVAEWRARPSTL
ncbi:helix-turn-helix transcriptional regulator [Streptomyces sp. NPDC087843]|uniref:helix-turn-helix transcriptional regulator n=1 Tax=Streptomyces sp. NPDC087843 TaxID=3365804 RepID=UPI0037F4BB97